MSIDVEITKILMDVESIRARMCGPKKFEYMLHSSLVLAELNVLGLAGWEVVSVLAREHGANTILLKRSI